MSGMKRTLTLLLTGTALLCAARTAHGFTAVSSRVSSMCGCKTTSERSRYSDSSQSQRHAFFNKGSSDKSDDDETESTDDTFQLPAMLRRRERDDVTIPGASPQESERTGWIQAITKKQLNAKSKDSDDDASPPDGANNRWWRKIRFVDGDGVKNAIGSNSSPQAESTSLKTNKKKMSKLQKQLEANQKRQLKLIEQIRLDEAAEERALKEEQALAAELVKLEEQQKRKQQELARKTREAVDRRKVQDAERRARNQNPPSVAQKFLSSRSSKQEKKEDESGDKESFWSSKLISGIWESFGGQEEWVPVMPKTRMFPGEVVPVEIGGIDLLVVASRDGRKLHCLANSCSHLGTPLELGLVESRPCGKGSTVRSLSNTQEVEDCIICPLHHTAFSLDSGDVRGEWCPYPPIVGAMTATLKPKSPVAVFDIRTRGKNIEVRINSSVDDAGQKKDVPARKQRGSSATRADQ